MLCQMWTGRIKDGRVAWMAPLPEARTSAGPMAAATVNKTVRVRMVYIDDRPRRVDAPQTDYTINGMHTLQEVVTQMYPAFPGRCMWVTRCAPTRYEREDLWDRTRDPLGTAFFAADLYSRLQDRDRIEIYVDQRQPGGPQPSVERGEPAAAPHERVNRGEGPRGGPHEAHACLRWKLDELKTLAA